MNIFFAVLLVLSGLLLSAQLANLVSMRGSDPLGRALSHSFGIIITVGLWILIVALLALARTKGAFPAFTGWAAMFLLPASLAAQLAINNLFKSRLEIRWLIIPAALLSLAAILFAVALWVSSLRPLIETFRANCFVWGSILLLCALPWPAVRKQALWNAAEVAKHERQEASTVQAHKERFARLTPDSPLSQWLEFAGWESDLRNEALKGIRQLPRRQAEAERLLAEGEGVILELLSLLELQATPALCLQANRFLCDFAKSFAKPVENPNSLQLAAHRLERYTNALAWFSDHKGDISTGLNCLADFARLHPNSPQRQEILARLNACLLKK